MESTPVDVPHATCDASSERVKLVTTPSLLAYKMYSLKSIYHTLRSWSSPPVTQKPELTTKLLIAALSCNLYTS